MKPVVVMEIGNRDHALGLRFARENALDHRFQLERDHLGHHPNLAPPDDALDRLPVDRARSSDDHRRHRCPPARAVRDPTPANPDRCPRFAIANATDRRRLNASPL